MFTCQSAVLKGYRGVPGRGDCQRPEGDPHFNEGPRMSPREIVSFCMDQARWEGKERSFQAEEAAQAKASDESKPGNEVLMRPR